MPLSWHYATSRQYSPVPAPHSGEYTFVGLDRQEALTRAIQERLAKAAPQDDDPGTSTPQREHLTRARRAKQEKAKVVAINAKESAA